MGGPSRVQSMSDLPAGEPSVGVGVCFFGEYGADYGRVCLSPRGGHCLPSLNSFLICRGGTVASPASKRCCGEEVKRVTVPQSPVHAWHILDVCSGPWAWLPYSP